MKSFIIFVHFELTPSFVPKLPLCFSSSTFSTSSQPQYHPFSFGSFSHLSSLLKTQNLSFQFRNPNSKLQDDVKMRLSARLGPMGVQENSGKTKWSLGGESGYPKTKTLTSKCVLDSQICVQDSSTNKKQHQTSLPDH